MCYWNQSWFNLKTLLSLFYQDKQEHVSYETLVFKIANINVHKKMWMLSLEKTYFWIEIIQQKSYQNQFYSDKPIIVFVSGTLNIPRLCSHVFI